jgi:hypothetical protein
VVFITAIHCDYHRRPVFGLSGQFGAERPMAEKFGNSVVRNQFAENPQFLFRAAAS